MLILMKFRFNLFLNPRSPQCSPESFGVHQQHRNKSRRSPDPGSTLFPRGFRRGHIIDAKGFSEKSVATTWSIDVNRFPLLKCAATLCCGSTLFNKIMNVSQELCECYLGVTYNNS